MARCDLCGKHCEAQELDELPRQEKVRGVRGVRDVCPACSGWINGVRRQLMDEVAPQVREAIKARRTDKPRPWWSALLAKPTDQ